MTIDWGIIQFKRKIIDNARYLFKNYIDTSKGLDALYNRPQISTEKAICYKNFNAVRVTSNTSGEHITVWEIDDAINVNKLYIRAKVNATTDYDGSLIITDSTLANGILFTITPKATTSDFRIVLRINGSHSIIYMESVDLSFNQFYDIEGMIDFKNNTISVARDNGVKPVVTTETLPSFDVIHIGFRAAYSQNIPNVIGKDVIITWE